MVGKEDVAIVAVVVGDTAHGNGACPMFAGPWGKIGELGVWM